MESTEKSTNRPFVKDDEGSFVLKSIDEKQFDELHAKSGFSYSMVFRDYIDAIGMENHILNKKGLEFASQNGIRASPIGKFDYTTSELNEKDLLEKKTEEKHLNSFEITNQTNRNPNSTNSSVDVYPNGNIEILIFDKSSVENASELMGKLDSELKKLPEIINLIESTNDGNKMVILNNIKENNKPLQEHIIKTFDSLSINYLDTPLVSLKKSIFSNPNHQTTKTMTTENTEVKDQVIGFATKYQWKEDDLSERSYLINLNKEKVMAIKEDQFGSVKVGIKKYDQEMPGENNNIVSKTTYKAVLYPKKDDNDMEVVISIKKSALAKIEGVGDYNNVNVIVSNRKPEFAKKDDLVVYENPIKEGMNDKEKKKALENKNYVGTGWTQKPELLKLDKDQINKEELKKSIGENNYIRSQAIILRGGKKLVTKDVVDEIVKAKEKHGEKFNPAIEKAITDIKKPNKKENKIKI